LLVLQTIGVCTAARAADAAWIAPETRAQALLVATMRRHPEVAHVVLHVTPPGKQDTDNLIIASSIGHIGKRADEDDLRILRTGATEAVITKGGDRYNVSLPLLDRVGTTIGIVAIGFPYQRGDDLEVRRAVAKRIRDELRRNIASVSTLFVTH
jgi:hypothetical protein